jgi:ABC-type iron transport system FetAB ATPase subunit
VRKSAQCAYLEWLVSGNAFFWAARRAMRFSATAGSCNMSGESMDQLWAETSRLAIAYLQQQLPLITGDIVSVQDIVFSLLEGRQRPRESRDLYVIGGLASGMLSKASHDLSDPDAAMTHARTALFAREQRRAPCTRLVGAGTSVPSHLLGATSEGIP